MAEPTFNWFRISLPPSVVPNDMIYPGTPVIDSQLIVEFNGANTEPFNGLISSGQSCAAIWKIENSIAIKDNGIAKILGRHMYHFFFIACS